MKFEWICPDCSAEHKTELNLSLNLICSRCKAQWWKFPIMTGRAERYPEVAKVVWANPPRGTPM